MKNTLKNTLKNAKFSTYQSGESYVDDNNTHSVTMSEVIDTFINVFAEYSTDFPYTYYHDNYQTDIAIGKFMLDGVTYNNPIIYKIIIEIQPSFENRNKKYYDMKTYVFYVFIDQYYKLRYLDLPMNVTVEEYIKPENADIRYPGKSYKYIPDLTKFSRKTRLFTSKFLQTLP